MPPLPRAAIWLAGLLAIAGARAHAATFPDFDLPLWKSDERVKLADFAGQILVLDFFAYWCAPCEAASRELETGVQQHYAAAGNPRGVPVRVLSVNIEKAFPDRTERFLRRTGASRVAHDPDGALLKQLGIAGIPLLVVVDGTTTPRHEIIYQRAGFEGGGKLREIIDALGPQPVPAVVTAPPASEEKPTPPPAELPPARPPIVESLEADTDIAFTRDILLTDTKLAYKQARGATRWELGGGLSTFALDYQPFRSFDFLGFKEKLAAQRVSGSLGLRQRLAAPLTWMVSGGVYDGWSDYRRVWIANYYRQNFDNPRFPRIPPYEPPDPKGANVSTGLRWEYLPATAFAELRVGYAKDEIAPGYEIGKDTNDNTILLAGRKRLDTRSLAVSTENILGPRLRALNEFSLVSTSDREPRFGYQGSINLALGERWVVRAYGGITTESTNFDAFFYGATLEYEAAPGLLLSLTGRRYEDTGEILDGFLLSSAAPPLKSWQVGAGLRYAWGRSALKIHVGKFFTDYAQLNVSSALFFHLYQDRHWGLAQVAYTCSF